MASRLSRRQCGKYKLVIKFTQFKLEICMAYLVLNGLLYSDCNCVTGEFCRVPFLRASYKFRDLIDLGDFHEICFTEKLAEILL